MSKLFNKLDKGASKFFNKSEKEIKLLGRGARSVAKTIGGALGSAGGEVAKAAKTIEKETGGTPIGTIAGKVARGAGAVQSGGKALKALGKGDIKGAVKLGTAAEKGVMSLV